MPPATALIRPVPDSFDRALVRVGRPAIDVGLARAEHREYRRHLEEAGLTIEEVPTDEAHPDCVFIEDTAVVVGPVGVITRPGAPERRDETGPVASALGAHLPLAAITAPGTLDGGDVFTARETVYVGRSQRSNEEGIRQLRSVALDHGLRLVAIEVHDALHLKSVVLPIDAETVVVTPNSVEEDQLAGFRIVYEDAAERHSFSALPLTSGRVLVTESAPRTAAAIAALGHHPIPIDVSQIQLADGGLTCMSILL
jgi:dimethylargininase